MQTIIPRNEQLEAAMQRAKRRAQAANARGDQGAVNRANAHYAALRRQHASRPTG